MWHERALKLGKESSAKLAEATKWHICLHCNCVARNTTLICSSLPQPMIHPYSIEIARETNEYSNFTLNCFERYALDSITD
jgi:hypothetical protein